MAVETSQNFNVLSPVPNFERDNVEQLYKNSESKDFYPIGHIVWVNPPKPSENASEDELTLYNNAKGGYVWTGAYVRGVGDNGTDGWVKFIDGFGKLLIDGDSIIVEDRLDENSKNPVQNKIITLHLNEMKEFVTSVSQIVEQNKKNILVNKESLDSTNQKITEDREQITLIKNSVTQLSDKVANNSTTIGEHTTDIGQINTRLEGVDSKLESLQSAIHIVGIIENISDLPAVGNAGDMYLVREKQDGSKPINSYDEYLWVQKIDDATQNPLPPKWELVGSTTVDTTNLVTKDDLQKELETIGQEFTKRDTKIQANTDKNLEQDTSIGHMKDRLGEMETPIIRVDNISDVFEAFGVGEVDIQVSGIIRCTKSKVGVNTKGEVISISNDIIPESASWRILRGSQGENVMVRGDIVPPSDRMAIPAEAKIRLASQTASPVARFVAKMAVVGRGTYEKHYNLYLVHRRFYGKVGASVTKEDIIANSDIIKGLTKAPMSQYNDITFSQVLSNEKTVYAFPNYMGEISSVKDANNFQIKSGFEKFTVSIDGIDYLVYMEKSAATTSNPAKYQIY